LQHRPRRRHGVAAAFHFDRVEMGPVGDVIGGIAFTPNQVARREFDEPIRAGSNWL